MQQYILDNPRAPSLDATVVPEGRCVPIYRDRGIQVCHSASAQSFQDSPFADENSRGLMRTLRWKQRCLSWPAETRGFAPTEEVFWEFDYRDKVAAS